MVKAKQTFCVILLHQANAYEIMNVNENTKRLASENKLHGIIFFFVALHSLSHLAPDN